MCQIFIQGEIMTHNTLRKFIKKVLKEAQSQQMGYRRGVAGYGRMFKGTMPGPIAYRFQPKPMVPGIYEDEESPEDEEILEEEE
jgi:hypothetical protein|tara:strand:- start:121 stop:372 length:252 start_codon:yes stop_codon:yes gene_type:complete